MFDTFIIEPILNALLFIYSIIPGGDFGIAIIVFTIIVRILLYPLTKGMLHQTKVMRKLQPELKKIKKQYKNNRRMMQLKQMELFKERGVNPFRSLGILLIQLPIFIGLFYVIKIITEQRDRVEGLTYSFIQSMQPVQEIIQNPGGFNETLLGFVDLTKAAIHSGGVEFTLVALALVAAYTQYVMSKQTTPHTESKRRLRDIMAEAAEGKQADQDEMNAIVMRKMMKILPFFMFYIMLIVPGALALYYGVSNIVAVLQQHYLLKQDEEELEEISNMPDKKLHKTTSAKNKKGKKKTPQKESETTVVRISAKDTRKRRK